MYPWNLGRNRQENIENEEEEINPFLEEEFSSDESIYDNKC